MFDLCPWRLLAGGTCGALAPSDAPLAFALALAVERRAIGGGDARRPASRGRCDGRRPSRPGARGGRGVGVRRARDLRGVVRCSAAFPDRRTPADLGAPRMAANRGHGAVLGSGGWRARGVAGRSALRRTRASEADLGVVRLHGCEAMPRGDPSGVVPREPLERPRGIVRDPIPKKCARIPGGSPIQSACIGEPGYRSDPAQEPYAAVGSPLLPVTGQAVGRPIPPADDSARGPRNGSRRSASHRLFAGTSRPARPGTADPRCRSSRRRTRARSGNPSACTAPHRGACRGGAHRRPESFRGRRWRSGGG